MGEESVVLGHFLPAISGAGMIYRTKYVAVSDRKEELMIWVALIALYAMEKWINS